MKFIPDVVARKVASQQLLASENSPKLLFVGGVIGMVGSTVLACRGTLKLEEVLEKIDADKKQANQIHAAVNDPIYVGDATYTDSELKKDLGIIATRGVVNVVKLYAPSVILGGISIAALTKSHHILQDRNLALTAVYTAVDAAFTKYRERVIEKHGEEEDRFMMYGSEQIDVVDEETGEIVTTLQALDTDGSAYARFYDEVSSANWSVDPEINMMFLRTAQNYCNDRLKARGHMFLNEVFRELGLSHTQAGAVVGWRWNKESGDDYIDFGIWDGVQEAVNNFFNGREGAILLDFNVDGIIYDKIEETGR